EGRPYGHRSSSQPVTPCRALYAWSPANPTIRPRSASEALNGLSQSLDIRRCGDSFLARTTARQPRVAKKPASRQVTLQISGTPASFNAPMPHHTISTATRAGSRKYGIDRSSDKGGGEDEPGWPVPAWAMFFIDEIPGG